MSAFLNELVSLDTVYHAGGLAHKMANGHWRELIWNVDEMKEMMAEDGVAFATEYPMSCQFLTALDAQNEVVQRRGVRQIIRVYGIDAGNQHHDNGVVWRTIDVYMFKDEGAHVLRYFKCAVGSSSSEGTAAEVKSTGTQSFSMNSKISGSEPIEDFDEDVRLQHQFQATDGKQRAVGISVVTDYGADFNAAALEEHHANKAARKHGSTVPTKTAEQKLHDAHAWHKRFSGKMTKAQFAKERGYSEGSGSSDTKPVDADEERSAPPSALNDLFTKEADEIEPKRREWSKWTADQCRRGANTMVDDGNGNLVRACVKGGMASVEKKRKSPARDANYKMADGSAPENDLQQFTSEGGNAGSKNRQQRLKGEDQKVYEVGYFEGHSSQHLSDLGLGLKQAKRKAKAVEKAALKAVKAALEKAAAVAFEMEVLTAVLKVPGTTKKRKQRVAEKMSPAIPSGSHSYKRGKFHIAWMKYEHLAA